MIKKIFVFVLRSPLIWGAAACAVFYILIFKGIISNSLVVRYCAGHPVEYCECLLFFVGIAALLIKGGSVWSQIRYSSQGLFGSAGKALPPASAAAMAERLDTFSVHRKGSYLIERFRRALDFIKRNQSAQGLEDELKYLSDMDSSAMQQSYALSRIIVWAIPILGFLGTVIGITVAMGELGVSVSDSGDSLKNMLAGLSVAFDTTALALALSMVLMFTQYVVERRENELLACVDSVANRELAGRFEVIPDGPEGELTAIRRMMESVLSSIQQSASRQAEVWQNAFENTDSLWQKRLDQTGEALRKNLAAALTESLSVAIGQTLSQTLNQQNQAFLQAQQQLQTTACSGMEKAAKGFNDSSAVLNSSQANIARQVEMLSKVYSATDKIGALENALNHNLTALAGSKNFEKTVMSLAAAIQMLAVRMSEMPSSNNSVELNIKKEAA